MQAAPQIRAEIKNFVRCCDILFNAAPLISLNVDEQEVMIAYIGRMNQKFSLVSPTLSTASEGGSR
jgi:hypothetical protein